MVYIDKRRYKRAYDSILAAARESASSSSGTVSVLILVAPDVDALCACRILMKMLSHDHVGYNVVPVSGWSELARVNREMVEDNRKLRTVILLNLGSLVDLSEYFGLPEQATLHVIDSHRPWNLDNLFSATLEAEKVVVWDDGDVEEDMKEEREAFEALQYEPDTDSEDEYEDTDDEDLHWRERQRRLLEDSDESDSDRSEDDGNGSDGSSRGKRRRLDAEGNEVANGESKKPKRLSRRKKLLHQTRIQKYYAAGTWYGESVAGQMYTLATVLRRSDNDYLWLAVLGLTYQFTANLIDRERYELSASVLSNEVERLNIAGPQGTNSGFASAANNPDDRSIRLSEEFRFMLFRHWNLYDAMFHSGYVASKLKLWRDRGRKNLQGLLAKMGFSLEQCRQSYTHMDMDLKRSLRSKVDDIAPEYGLYDLSYPSFVRAFGYQSVLSAGDVVECVSALLEVSNGVRLDFGNDGGGIGGGGGGGAMWNASRHWLSGVGVEDGGIEDEVDGMTISRHQTHREAGEGGGSGGSNKENEGPNGSLNANGAVARAEEAAAVAAAKAKRKEEAWWVRNFWMAYDSLGNDTTLLRSALPLSMALHRAIIRQGINILDKQAVKTLRTLRFCVIKESASGSAALTSAAGGGGGGLGGAGAGGGSAASDLRIFTHPATLLKLAHWLVDAIRDLLEQAHQNNIRRPHSQQQRIKTLPFVLAALDEKRDAFLVVGITGAAEYGDVRKNKFGLAFQEAAKLSGTRTRHDKFEASVVEVRKDDLTAFIQRLHMKL